jgi:quinol monooxygenase YgiN
MSVHMAQARIKPEGVGDVRAATEKMFAAINAAEPQGIRYASLVSEDGETFLAIVQLDDDVENPVPGLPEFRELQEVVEGSRAEPNTLRSFTVVGSYRLF